MPLKATTSCCVAKVDTLATDHNNGTNQVKTMPEGQCGCEKASVYILTTELSSSYLSRICPPPPS
jgi:hypothetical protein